MDFPFSANQFLDLFSRYNESVWPAHIVLRTLALLVVAFLFVGQKAMDRTIMAILSLFWLWMALVYHLAFFTTINPAAWLFGALFLLQAAWLFWLGVIKGKVRFGFIWDRRDFAGLFLLLLALIIYPTLSYLVGHRYPAVPTFGLPCPTTIFTLGVLLVAKPPVPKSLFVIPLIWTAIGSVAAFKLEVHQDLSLLLAGLIGLVGVLAMKTPARLADRA